MFYISPADPPAPATPAWVFFISNSPEKRPKAVLLRVYSMETAPTVKLPWEELPGRILVKTVYDDIGQYTHYYRVIKQNAKSAWIARCDRDGRCWTMVDGWVNEKWKRSSIPRTALA